MAMTIDKVLTTHAITQYDFDPGVDTAVDIGWVDMRDFDNFVGIFFRTVGTGALDTFTVLGNPASNGSGTDVIIKAHAVASEPNAVGDYIFLEVTAEEIADADTVLGTVRYVSISAEFETSTDEGVVTYIRTGAKRAYDGLSADTIA
jgi:hypothetical protein